MIYDPFADAVVGVGAGVGVGVGAGVGLGVAVGEGVGVGVGVLERGLVVVPPTGNQADPLQ